MGALAVFFFADTYRTGLTSHFAQLIPYLYSRMSSNTDFFVVSHKTEQEHGLWKTVETEIPATCIVKYNDWKDPECFVRVVNELLPNRERAVFHVHGYRHLKYLLPLKKQFGSRVRIVVWVHAFRNGRGAVQRTLTSLLIGRLYRRWVDRVLFLSPFAWRSFVGGTRMMRDGHATFIPLGVEPFTDILTPAKGDLPADLHTALTAQSGLNLIYLANFTRNKGHQWLIEGCAPVLKANRDTRLLLLGEGPLRRTIAQLVSECQIAEQVLLPGRIDHKFLPWILKRCHIALTATGSETCGHNAIEPYLAGIPVIGTRVGTAEYLLQDGNTGWGIGHKNMRQLRCVLDAAIKDPVALKEMGLRGKRICETLFTHEAVSVSLARLYRELLEAPHVTK